MFSLLGGQFTAKAFKCLFLEHSLDNHLIVFAFSIFLFYYFSTMTMTADGC